MSPLLLRLRLLYQGTFDTSPFPSLFLDNNTNISVNRSFPLVYISCSHGEQVSSQHDSAGWFTGELKPWQLKWQRAFTMKIQRNESVQGFLLSFYEATGFCSILYFRFSFQFRSRPSCFPRLSRRFRRRRRLSLKEFGIPFGQRRTSNYPTSRGFVSRSIIYHETMRVVRLADLNMSGFTVCISQTVSKALDSSTMGG